MADFVNVQAASRTTAGTQDFTSSGFGTPKGALFIVTSGTVNGTVASHALLGGGATDGTRNLSMASYQKDAIALGVTNAGRRGDTTDCLLLINQDGTVILRAQFSSWITDGVRINFSVAPSSAYLITAVLMGGSGVSDVYVSTAVTPVTINTGIDVTAPGFEPTFVLALSGTNPFDNVDYGTAQFVLGIAQNDGSNPHPQYEGMLYEEDAVATTDISGRVRNATIASYGGAAAEVQDFDASGFSAFTRLAGTAVTFGYIAVKLSGISAKVMAVDSPTGGGSQTISSIGFTPQWGLLLMSASLAYGTTYTDTNAEVLGVSVFTADSQYCHAITADDAVVTTTNCEAVTHSRPVFLRKDSATFMDATFTTFGDGTAEFNYATANGTLRKWAALFVQTGITEPGAGADSLSTGTTDAARPITVTLSIQESG